MPYRVGRVSRFSPRLVLWGLVVMLLIVALLTSWRNIAPEANKTGYILAENTILETANLYKQNWLVKQKPNNIEVDGRQWNFSSNGWLVPTSEDQQGCDEWLRFLYPEISILGGKPSKAEFIRVDDGYICRYNYVDNNAIVIKLLGNSFSVSVDFSAL